MDFFKWFKKQPTKTADKEHIEKSSSEDITAEKTAETAEPSLENVAVEKSAETAEPSSENVAAEKSEGTIEPSSENIAAEKTAETAEPSLENVAVEKSAETAEPSSENVAAEKSEGTIEPSSENIAAEKTAETAEPSSENIAAEKSAEAEVSYFARLKMGLAKTRDNFAAVFLGKKALDQDLLDDLEMRLLTADCGIEITEKIIAHIKDKMNRKELADSDAVQKAIADYMIELLTPYEQPLCVEKHQPFVILMAGINGAGKTTTIGKLSHRLQQEGKKIMLAAADTFRAAAVEQLQTWGERHHIPVIAQKTGADAASVAYDALQSAQARKMDVLIIDTAGRLHTQDHLMDELKKVKRVLQKLDDKVPHETLLVIDAGNGQNALKQALSFHQDIGVDGLVITKLDGSAKGGILFAITEKLKVPIRFVGVGERSDDLHAFNAKNFVFALLYDK
ncbi:signal recognition particle-docking protein FtsY [Dichelobacter nodosus]|uniref:signal recognition particle-docking protein FtsY n=1 Tax=Dichelobacter nodosus TaxID=870 RepID=UPI000E293BF0|nr:signal recognition particle-docking protein FtsY [Dichelobacter nodosus]AXM45676.1 signal recognition particle-docking protein FtsY [Dichelobacter nodosus]